MSVLLANIWCCISLSAKNIVSLFTNIFNPLFLSQSTKCWHFYFTIGCCCQSSFFRTGCFVSNTTIFPNSMEIRINKTTGCAFIAGYACIYNQPFDFYNWILALKLLKFRNPTIKQITFWVSRQNMIHRRKNIYATVTNVLINMYTYMLNYFILMKWWLAFEFFVPNLYRLDRKNLTKIHEQS